MLQKINQPNKQKKHQQQQQQQPHYKNPNRFSNNDTYLFFKSVQLMRFIDLNIVF